MSGETDVHVPPTASQYPSPPNGSSVETLSQTKPHVEPRSDVDLLADLAMDLATRNGKVTADDLRFVAPNAPKKRSNYGAVFLKLVKSGQLVLVTFQHSQAPGNNGRRIGVYAKPIEPKHRVCP